MPPKRSKDVEVEDLFARARARLEEGTGGRSRLYGWMWEHHAALVPKMIEPTAGGSAWWSALAIEFASLGLTDGGRGDEAPKPPTGNTARQTWWKVCRDKEALLRGDLPKRRGRPRKLAVAATVEARGGSITSSASPPDAEGDDAGEPIFQVARAKGLKPSGGGQ